MIITNTGILLKVEDEDIKTRNCFIPEGVTTIGSAAFKNVTKPISRLKLPETLKRIRANAFSGLNLRYINIPASCRHIEEGAFAGCEDLISVEASGKRDTFISLGEGAFMGCKNLVSADLAVKCIPENAFMGCKNLDMTISPDIEEIGNRAFYEAGIKSVTIGKHHRLMSIGEYAFGECKKLEIVSIDTSEGNRRGKKLVISDLAFAQSGAYDVILRGQFNLGEMIFENCPHLSDVSLRGINHIPYGMFEECFRLATVDIEQEEIKSIGDFAFCKTQIPREKFSDDAEIKRNSFANLNKRAMRRAALVC